MNVSLAASHAATSSSTPPPEHEPGAPSRLARLASLGASNAGAGASAAAMALVGARVLGAARPWLVVLLAFAVTTFSYALDRTLDPSPGRPARAWRLVFAAAGWALVALRVRALGYGLAAVHSLLFPISVLAYAQPWLELDIGQTTVRRIKDIPFTKPLYVAFMWAQLGISASLFVPRPSTLAAVGVTSWIFLKSIVNAAACDLDDVAEDRARGVRTWPVLFGRARTANALQLLNAASALPVLVAIASGALPRSMAWVELLAVYFAICLGLMREESPKRPFGKAAFDAGSALVLLPIAAFVIR